MRRLTTVLISAQLVACLGPDKGLHLEDDVGDDGNTINSPYARGAVVTINADGWRSNRIDETWSIVPTDEGVLAQVTPDDDSESHEDEEETFTVDLQAVAEGTTTVSLIDPDGEVRATTTIEVVLPDTVTLHVATAERSGLPELASEECGVTIVEGGTGGLIAQYWAGQVEVFGNGILTLSTEDPTELDVDQSYSGKNLDWLQLTPTTAGSHTVDLFVDGERLKTLTYESVPSEDISSTSLLGGDETDAEQGDWIELLAQSFGADDCPVYGAQWNWHVDGQLQDELGDIYRYEFDESINTTLDLQFGDHEHTTTVHGLGTVTDSNAAGCSAIAGSAAFAPALFGLLALARRRED